MKKLITILSIAVIIIVLSSILGGCAYEPARRYMQTDPNYPNNAALPETPAIPNNLVGGSDTNRISATYEVVDFSYITLTADSTNVRQGAGSSFPSIGTIRSGQKIRALGKLDGWYIIKMPNSSRVGCIPAKYAVPSGTGGTPSGGTNAAAPTPAQTQKPAKTGATTMSSDESRILQLVNAERQKAGASPLKANGEVAGLARTKSQDMVNNNYFSHQSPTYGSPFDMLKNGGVSYMYAGENIAINQTADGAFKAWMNSEGHRKNILNPNFTELGVGIAPKGNGSYVYTQLFIGK